MTKIPVACTLSAGGAVDRVGEWRAFLQASVEAVERQPTVARLLLRPGDDVVLGALDLARREKACCGFFDFRVVPLPESTWLEVEVPADAAAVLDDFASVVTGPERALA